MSRQDERLRNYALVGLLAILSASLWSCGEPTDFEKRVLERFEQKEATLRLADVADFEWTFVCHLGGYASLPEYGVSNSESEWTLLFFVDEKNYRKVQGSNSSFEIDGKREYSCFGREVVGSLVYLTPQGRKARILDLSEAEATRRLPEGTR